MQQDDSRQALALLKKHFQVTQGEPLNEALSDGEGLAAVRQALTAQITILLDREFERLLQAMYRIDVNEQEFRAVLTGEAPVAPALAELVLQRELKKVETRRLYSSVQKV
jgi:hypothetical protein